MKADSTSLMIHVLVKCVQVNRDSNMVVCDTVVSANPALEWLGPLNTDIGSGQLVFSWIYPPTSYDLFDATLVLELSSSSRSGGAWDERRDSRREQGMCATCAHVMIVIRRDPTDCCHRVASGEKNATIPPPYNLQLPTPTAHHHKPRRPVLGPNIMISTSSIEAYQPVRRN